GNLAQGELAALAHVEHRAERIRLEQRLERCRAHRLVSHELSILRSAPAAAPAPRPPSRPRVAASPMWSARGTAPGRGLARRPPHAAGAPRSAAACAPG